MDPRFPETSFPMNPIRVAPTLQFDPVKTADDLHRYWRSQAVEGYLERHWPGKVDLDAWIPGIRGLLVKQFPQFADAEIKYFSAGTFNRLYSISSPDWTTTYIFRISIPVEPFFKTESEVATMEYVRQHTSIPVPRVIAFCSSNANELGYEWILMEMMQGVPLRTVWNKMAEAARIKFFAEVATHAKKLLSLRFSGFGSIYFADVADRVEGRSLLATPNSNNDTNGTNGVNGVNGRIGLNGPFVLGRIVSQDFFFNKRVHFSGSRGPFQTTRQLVDARMNLLGQRIQNLSTTPGEPYFCGSDEALARHKSLVDVVFSQLTALVPQLVPQDNGPEDVGVLWHDDLSQHNMLVDPVTYKLAGIVDWEAVSILPAYESYDALPAFLSDRDWRPIPLTLIERGVKPNDEVVAAKILEREKEFGAIRREYHRIVGPLYDSTSAETQRRLKNKRGLAKQLELPQFEHRPWATAAWMVEMGLVGTTAVGVAEDNGTEATAYGAQENGTTDAPMLETDVYAA